jgi:uncharacterized protein YyaL (SSP411 family)
VKVDREERPDVDRIYMDFVVRTSGHGGWPLTVFCTPDGRPFWGGTYFPPAPRHGLPSFRDVLSGLGRAWATQRAELEESATQVVAQLSRRPQGVAAQPPGAHSLCDAATGLLEGADPESGGFGGAPKFPTPTSLDALLAALDVLPATTAQAALDHLLLSCREMARRGLFDQLGGGFHRYCVDASWTIPHFEKMLYDEGQLLRVYAETWRRSDAKDDELVWPIRETVAYLRREMAAPDGGFFASQDADSEGEEGKYYVWTPGEVRAVLGAERGDTFCAAYGVTKSGNFEHATTQLVDAARRERSIFAAERAELLAVRARRIPPATDRKRVASWNAYLISGLARAGSLLGDAAMLADAVATADFVLTKTDLSDVKLGDFKDANGPVSTPAKAEAPKSSSTTNCSPGWKAGKPRPSSFSRRRRRESACRRSSPASRKALKNCPELARSGGVNARCARRRRDMERKR